MLVRYVRSPKFGNQRNKISMSSMVVFMVSKTLKQRSANQGCRKGYTRLHVQEVPSTYNSRT